MNTPEQVALGSGFEIQQLAPTAVDDVTLAPALTVLINEVYRVAEAGLWVDGAARTTAQEVTELIRAEEIAVARLHTELVGCVRIQELDSDTGEFGMLAAYSSHRGIGIGRQLVRFAEQRSRDRGHRSMQLELLVPRKWKHPSKQFLAGWYGRIGYAVTRTGTIDDAYPHLAPLLATPCDLLIYQKDLRD